MDRQSHYTWTLTRDELNTILDALREDEKRCWERVHYWEEQERYDLAEMNRTFATDRFGLRRQIVRLKGYR